MAESKEKISMVLYEWKIEKAKGNTDFEGFFNQKATEGSINGFEKAEEEGKYNIYKDSYVMVIDGDGNIVEDIQKSGPRPTVSNIKISTDGTTEVADNSQEVGTKLQISFDTSIKNGTIKSVTPVVPYTTNGTETEVTFTIVGTVDGIDYNKTQKISVKGKYQKPFEGTTVEEAIEYGRVLNTSKNVEIKDSNNNKIVIPTGFKVTNDATTVDKGIVIEDETSGATAGSQFVWVPLGTITKEDGSTVTINLDRYTFNTNGVPTAQGEKAIDSYYSETASKGNTVAKDINAFKTSAVTNGGYYIGRYEARTTTKRTAAGNTLTQITEKGTDQIYNYVTQKQAAQLSKNMYDNTNQFTSDLMNSYAWDTAILFLQKCGTNSKYSRQISVNSTLSQTGTKDDVQCNVYDMSSNIREWTTETSSYSGSPCVNRGSGFYDGGYTSGRYYGRTSASYNTLGFRTLLFVQLQALNR